MDDVKIIYCHWVGKSEKDADSIEQAIKQMLLEGWTFKEAILRGSSGCFLCFLK
ncbi:MAG: hypothetical protein ACFFCS_06640 [Candidatus Hodarchaeota archaeon]